MRRPDTKDRIYTLIEKIKTRIPDIVLRTTFIVGLPGETDEQFRQLLQFVNWARFDAMGAFKYSPEPGTEAAGMPDQVPDDVKEDRLNELMLAQQEIVFEKNKKRKGSKFKCLVDSKMSNNKAVGRYFGQALDIDSICIINKCSAQPGQFIDAKVINTKDYDFIVEQI
jgi:ribosomal protein S12 methylthiotransferase